MSDPVQASIWPPDSLEPAPTAAGPVHYLYCDGTRVDMKDCISQGISGIILRYGPFALKAPIIRKYPTAIPGLTPTLSDNEYVTRINVEYLEREKVVYDRLRYAPGIARCIEIVRNGIVLEYYPNGNLSQRLTGAEPQQAEKTRIILGIVQSVLSCHQLAVLVHDIALRNFMVAPDQSLKMIDYSMASTFPIGTRLRAVNDRGVTLKLDLFHLGCAIYSISTWQDYDRHDIYGDEQQPPIGGMPDTTNVLYGDVIQRCWQGRYGSADDIQGDLSGFAAKR